MEAYADVNPVFFEYETNSAKKLLYLLYNNFINQIANAQALLENLKFVLGKTLTEMFERCYCTAEII